MDWIEEQIRSFWEPFEGVWGFYQGLDPEQQRMALLLLPVGVLGLMAWSMHYTYGDRVVIVLPAMLMRYSLLLLALPVLLAGKAAGRGWRMPRVLLRDWTAEPDPDRPEILMREVDPMRLPGSLRGRPAVNQRAKKSKATRRG